MQAIMEEKNAMDSRQAKPLLSLKWEHKLKHLRVILEAVMWEFVTVKEGRWEDLPGHSQRKQDLLAEMKSYDWTPSPAERDNPEMEIIKGQIVDLEYQTRKMLESHLSILQTQISDIEKRRGTFQAKVNPFMNAVKQYRAN